jgi:hypothetical protein
MRQPSIEDFVNLLLPQDPPCISLYMPTHRAHPENKQDPIRYRNLLRDLENSLRTKYPTREVRPLLEPYQALARDDLFWNYRTDGLAILSSKDRFQIFELQRPVPERAIAADSFHTKPLLRILQSADRFQILCLTRETVKLYEGNRDAIDPVDLRNVPATLTEALGEEKTQQRHVARSITPEAAYHHGVGSRKDEIETDMLKFFRVVDRAILENHSKPSKLPLILAALAEYHTPFRSVSHNPFLLPEGIAVNPQALSDDELRRLAWERMEPIYLGRLAKMVEDFQTARSRLQGSDDLSDIARAAVQGRVGFLLVEADRVVPGKVDPNTGQLQSAELADPEVDDVLDDLAELTLRNGGEVVVVPRERMPTTSGAAAVFRY